MRGLCAVAAVLVAGAAGGTSPPPADWLRIDYSALVDRRLPSHSGETVGELLVKLGGRPLPPGGESREDRAAHKLLDPLLEPYAFVLSDAVDALVPAPERPWVDLGSAWLPGAPQPAWVELLRARRYVVESDGRGRLRVFLPLDSGPGEARAAVRAAWDAAWPVLRHVFAAERRRLGSDRPLAVEARAYQHFRERTAFKLTEAAVEFSVADTRPSGDRPPLDLAEIASFLASGLQLEGARLDEDGTLRLLGSRTAQPPRMLGRPLALGDLAVAYRAVFHGGLAEPYMSLDRGMFPEESLVNYGGRLRDTALGLVSLLCDIRFKTFSLGLDLERGEDRRTEIRAAVPEFRTHIERLAADARSQDLVRQQTRLWFYPDAVDLTVAPQGDVLVLRRVRMSAASERFEAGAPAGGGQEEAPWTRATVEAVNRDYDRLARLFPELGDLDQVVRLLSLFTWLRIAEQGGDTIPELEALLAVELPAQPTPRTYPQLIAFNVLPSAGSAAPVLVLDRVPHAAAEARLNSRSGQPLPARRRLERAIAALDPREPQHAALASELEQTDVATFDDSAIDGLVYRAGRTRLLARTSVDHYRNLLASLPQEARESLAQRQGAGEGLRPITLGIGGLDLDMGQALARAGGQQLSLVAEERSARTAASRSAPSAPAAGEAWRVEPAGLPEISTPDHGLGAAGQQQRVEVGDRFVLTLSAADDAEVRTRKVVLDSRRLAERFERVENARLLTYTMQRDGATSKAVPLAPQPASAARPPALADLASGLAVLELKASAGETAALAVRLGSAGASPLDAEIPRALLRRVVVGAEGDTQPGQPAPAILPPSLGAPEAVMVLAPVELWLPPWAGGGITVPGEEDPARIAAGLNAWWSRGQEARAAVVGVDRAQSPQRWARAPLVDASSTALLLPDDAFPATHASVREGLMQSGASLVRSDPGAARLVIVISAEPPARFAERLRTLARDSRMKGKLVAAWSLAGPLRADLPAALLGEGVLAGFAFAESSAVERRSAPARIDELRAALQGGQQRVERLGPTFVWHF